ncbi:ABC transporter ATP-binding protein [Kroppenstedtia pulmonis]|uniref:ABC transporter ATP-binding protein n=1 Tax=Kroppenstedtia pulmonis TaxID=1380685 RepID=A0A7D4CMY1_9BACL|nr:ABC transporter ATP-binding protein [Kroppenstedtia pulmonis]
MLKSLIGLVKKTEGIIEINNKQIGSTTTFDLFADIGYVFQNPDTQLFCHTVEEKIQFGLKNRQIQPDELQERTERILEIIGLSHVRLAHPFSLSRGQRQKLAVATMLITNPSIILLDEPTTGQDEGSLLSLLTLLRKLVEENKTTIVMITHDMEVVAKYAT